MTEIFPSETRANLAADKQLLTASDRLSSLDSHQDLSKAGENKQIAPFDTVLEIGKRFREIPFNRVILPHMPLTKELLAHHAQGNLPFFAQVRFGISNEQMFPALAQVMTKAGIPTSLHLQLIAVPASHFNEKESHATTKDSTLVIAAAAASAGVFAQSLKVGLEKSCDNPNAIITYKDPIHGAPLIAAYSVAELNKTLMSPAVKKQTAKLRSLSLQEATHLHNEKNDSKQYLQSAAQMRLAAGVTTHSLTREELRSLAPQHMITYHHYIDDLEKNHITHIYDLLDGFETGLSQIAFALSFTARIIGDYKAENAVHNMYQPENTVKTVNELLG